jgi:streptomycin 6-kinase
MTKDKMQGEGDYDAARNYNKETTEFAKDQERVEKSAEIAKEALEGPEKEELEAAVKVGKDHARH